MRTLVAQVGLVTLGVSAEMSVILLALFSRPQEGGGRTKDKTMSAELDSLLLELLQKPK